MSCFGEREDYVIQISSIELDKRYRQKSMISAALYPYPGYAEACKAENPLRAISRIMFPSFDDLSAMTSGSSDEVAYLPRNSVARHGMLHLRWRV